MEEPLAGVDIRQITRPPYVHYYSQSVTFCNSEGFRGTDLCALGNGPACPQRLGNGGAESWSRKRMREETQRTGRKRYAL